MDTGRNFLYFFCGLTTHWAGYHPRFGPMGLLPGPLLETAQAWQANPVSPFRALAMARPRS